MIFSPNTIWASNWMKRGGSPSRRNKSPPTRPAVAPVPVLSLMLSPVWEETPFSLPKCAITFLPLKLTRTGFALALHNAKIYGVQYNIDFMVGDFFQLAPFLKGDVVFFSPPWGGPSYKAKKSFTLDSLKPKDGRCFFQVAQMITPNIIMYLPRNIDVLQASELSWLSSPLLDIEMEENLVRGRLKGITVYFGEAFP